MFHYDSLEDLVLADPPPRPIQAMVDEALRRMDETFEEIYGDLGQPSNAPERLLQASAADAAIHDSQRADARSSSCVATCRWRRFVGPGMSGEVWHATVFAKHRDGLLEAERARHFSSEIRRQVRQRGGMSSDDFPADKTMVEAWASQKSFQPKQ